MNGNRYRNRLAEGDRRGRKLLHEMMHLNECNMFARSPSTSHSGKVLERVIIISTRDACVYRVCIGLIKGQHLLLNTCSLTLAPHKETLGPSIAGGY